MHDSKWSRTDQEMLHVTKRVGNGKSQNNFEQNNSKKLWVARVLKLSWKYSFSLPLKRKKLDDKIAWSDSFMPSKWSAPEILSLSVDSKWAERGPWSNQWSLTTRDHKILHEFWSVVSRALSFSSSTDFFRFNQKVKALIPGFFLIFPSINLVFAAKKWRLFK